MKITPVVLLVTVILSASLMAAEGNPPTKPESIFKLGPGLLISDKAQKGADTDIMPIPIVYYERGRFTLSGTQGYWGFYRDNGATLAAIGKLRTEGYDDNESRHLRGMDDRRMTFEAGLYLAQEFDWGKLAAEWTSDVLNEHKGHEIRLTASHRFADVMGVEKLAVTPSVGGNWRSKQLNDYYYGVERDEATAVRAAYNAGSTVGLLTGLRLDYPLTERWDVFSSVSVEWLGSEITDSPIVDQHYRLGILIGALYSF